MIIKVAHSKRPGTKEPLVETQSHVTTESTDQGLHEQKLKRLSTRRLTQAVEENRFIVDYKKPFFDVCKEFLRFTIKSESFLDIIRRPWVPEDGMSEAERPSWLLTTFKLPWEMRPHGIYSRAIADTLVGPSVLGKRKL